MAQDTLQQARERYQDASDAFREQRARMVEDFKFSNPADPQQWDDKARQIRENGPDGARPCLTLDHTNQYVAQVVNDARQNKPAINFLPSSGGARQEVAEALNGVFRHIEYQSRAQIAYDTAIEHAARGGLGWIILRPEVVDAELNYQEIRIQRAHDPLSVLGDPDWIEPDGADLQYGFVTSFFTDSAFKRKWPKAKPFNWSTADVRSGWYSQNGARVCEYFERSETKSSRLAIMLPDSSKQTISEDDYWSKAKELGYQPMVVTQYMSTDYKVMWRTMTGAEILEETEFPSCYIPLVPVIGYELVIEGKRYLCGMVRRMMEAQRAYNYERSAWVETVALQPKAPFLSAAESIEGHENEWGAANRANKSYLPWNAYDESGRPNPKPERAAPPSLPAAFVQGAQFAENDIKASVGMYGDNIGAPSQQHSGKAILAKQREGDTANFHYIDNLSRSIERVGRIGLDMFTRLYDEPRESRILGQDGTTKPVKINPKGEPYALDGDMASINPSTGVYDVRVKAGPSYTTLRQEASDGLNQMMQGNPQIAAVVAPIWAQMQDWPMADKMSKALLAMAPPPVQQALNEDQGETVESLKAKLQQVSQQADQMAHVMQQASARIQELESEDKKTTLEYLARAAQLQNDEYARETDRMKVLAGAMAPEQVAQIAAQLVMQSLQREPMQDGEELENVVQGQAGLHDESPPQMAPPEMGEPPQDDTTNQGPSGPFSLPEQE